MSKGFTLVEVIVVLVILGVLLGVALPSIITYIDKADVKACEAKRVNIERQAIYLSALTHGADTRATLDSVLRGDYPDYVGGNDLKCPAGGSYSILNGHVNCDYPGHGGGTAGGPVSALKNYIYKADSDYATGKSYSAGQIVNKNGILFMCYKNTNSDGSPNSKGEPDISSWKIIGTADGEPVDMNKLGLQTSKYSFMPGVTVLYTGKTYIITPNTAMKDAKIGDRTELTEGSTLQKPPAMAMIPSALPYDGSSGAPEKGGYYYDKYGNLYRYNGESGSPAISTANISNGTWEPLSNYYINNVTYKAGATVWYKGKYYTASTDTSATPGGTGWTEQQ